MNPGPLNTSKGVEHDRGWGNTSPNTSKYYPSITIKIKHTETLRQKKGSCGYLSEVIVFMINQSGYQLRTEEKKS